MAKYLLLLVMFFSLSRTIYTTPSGIYIDNGEDQTILGRAISENELSTFERDMSKFLGLPQKLRRKRKIRILESSAPKFLLDVYNSLEGGSELSIRNEFNLSKKEIRSIGNSDSIMTFLMKDNVRHERSRLLFDVSDVPIGSTVLEAELRLFKKFRDSAIEKYTVTLHQILINLKGEKELGFVDAVNVSSNYEGWLIFNISSSFQSWIVFPSMNEGLHVSIHEFHRPDNEVTPKMIGLLLSRVSEGMKRRQPFLVGFVKNAVGNTKSKKRRPREISNKRKSENNSYSNLHRRTRMTKPPWDLRSCQLQTLYVNFRDLNWHDWVIAPDGFAAYFCAGHCEFPLSVHMNASNHAIVQTLAHLLAIAPKPACCAPKTYGSLSLLYYGNNDNNLVLVKKFKNAVVTSCGCH